jgi:probable rRNA maturation factor
LAEGKAGLGTRSRLDVVFNGKPGDKKLEKRVRKVLNAAAQGEGKKLKRVSVILTDDPSLRELNRSYLQDDAPTDVLSFDLSDDAREGIEGDIYVSLDRAAAQAQALGDPTGSEVMRLVLHGFLHLCGYDHADDRALKEMTDHGEQYLSGNKDEIVGN